MTAASVPDLEDPRRVEPAYVGDERAMLERWLDFHRTTLLFKCEGLDGASLKRQPVATSKLSLHGLVRHMAEGERTWFRRCFLRDPDMPFIFIAGNGDWDRALEPLDDAIWKDDLAAWQEECSASRDAAAGRSLDECGRLNERDVSLRWIFVHMIEEYARHNGHADILRELIDQQVGC